ncbi:4-alpha-glucanotransferase [Stenotrophomonas maltophilia]|uniref:4-alpha-glucanotransferase n=1 Tax=Stenotrophomonas maltophilia TaxID=40324 RepID=UPI00073980FE
MLRAVMAGRGGLRIDHILGLQRLWVLPRGAGAGQGVYLRYPFDDLINLLVLESWRHRCVLIGEDLGVVPPGIRQRLAARGVLGLEVLPFARNGERFLPAPRWRRDAVAMPSTHDLPPLAGWLRGRDLRWRARLGELTELPAALHARASEVQALSAVARGEGATLEARALSLVAHAPSRLALLPLEDALGSRAQVNLPGTVNGHPNWRRRLPLAWDPDAADARIARFSATRRKAGR